jgi:hypothetical protein
MEKVIKQIDDLLARSQKVGKTRKEKIKLYSEGLKAKLEQVQYALDQIKSFENRTDDLESTTAKDPFSITQKVNFYCDAFWTFLYSSLDVLSQITNQALKLQLDEEDVSFKSVNQKLQGNAHKDLNEAKAYLQCIKSHYYSNLDKYRNCSTHRRQIFVTESINKQISTPGYSTAPAITTVTRYLCDDPLKVKPKITIKRQIPKYMVDTKEKITKHIETILAETQPVK